MPALSVMFKMGSDQCNLACRYCYSIRPCVTQSSKQIEQAVIKALISQYMDYISDTGLAVISWQGGEPTLMGLDFFKKVVEFQLKYAPPGASISNGLQTNATMITEDFARFFGEYKFLLGVSLDGPERFHDFYRKTLGGKPTHSLVMRGI